MSVDENNNISKQNNDQKSEIYNQKFIENISDQRDILNNFFKVYLLKENDKNSNLEIYNEDDLFEYFKEIDKNFKKFFADQDFIDRLNESGGKTLREIKNKLMFMISNASRYLSIFFNENKDFLNFKINDKKFLENLSEDFFGKIGKGKEKIYEDISKNREFLINFNKSFPLSKIEIDLNTRELSLSDNNLEKYYSYIFKNIYWLRNFLEHKEDILNDTKEKLNIPIAILSLLLINDFLAKIYFNNIKSKYINILCDYIYEIKNKDEKDQIWKKESEKFNKFIQIERFFFKQLNILLNEKNLKLPYNNFESLDNCIKESEKSFGIFQYKDLLKNIEILENLKDEKNLEEKSFFYKKRDFYRQKNLLLFDQWHFFLFSLEDFLKNKFMLIEKNEEIMIACLKKFYQQELINRKIKLNEISDNEYILLYNFFEIKGKKEQEKAKIFFKNFFTKQKVIQQIISKQEKEIFKNNNIDKRLFNKVFRISKYFSEIKIFLNGYRHNKKFLFYINDEIYKERKKCKEQKNFKEILNEILKIINKLIKNFKEINTENWEDWFNFKDKQVNLKQEKYKILEDYKSNVLLEFSRLILNFQKNIVDINDENKNYFKREEVIATKHIKIFNKKNINQNDFEFNNFKKEILEKNNYDQISKKNILDFYKDITQIRKNKTNFSKIIEKRKNDFKFLYNVDFKINNNFKIQFIETKKIDFEYENITELLEAIQNKKELNRKKLLLYYQDILKYNNFPYKINDLSDINTEILEYLKKKNAFIISKKYYLFNEDKLKKIENIDEKIKLFFNNWLFKKIKLFDDFYQKDNNKFNEIFEEYQKLLQEKYFKMGLNLDKNLDKNLIFFNNYFNNYNFQKKYTKEKLEQKYLKEIKKKIDKKFEENFPFPTRTLFLLEGQGIKKNIIDFTSNKDFKNSFYSGKIRKKDNFNKNLFMNNFDFLVDEFDFDNNKFSEKFNFNDMKEYIENKIKEKNKNIKEHYYKNLILFPKEKLKLKYKIKSREWEPEILIFKNTFIYENQKLKLNKNEFDQIYNFFLNNEQEKNKYYLIFNELRKHKNSFKNNFSQKKFLNINLKESSFQFVAKSKVKRFSFKKTDYPSDYLIENIKIIYKINELFF